MMSLSRPVAWNPVWLQAHLRVMLWLAAGILFFGGWELYVRLSGISDLFLPPPSLVATMGAVMIFTADFHNDLWVTASEFFAGFGLAAIVGIPLGIAAGWYRRLFYVLNPFLASLYAMPRIVLLPWIMLVVGIDFAPKVIMTFLGAALPITVNVLYGVRTVDAALLTLARSFNASQLFVLRTIILPGVVPFALAGLRIGIGTGIIGVIVAEFATAQAGVGHLIHQAGHHMATAEVFVGIAAIAAGAIIMTAIVGRIERYFQRWRPQ